MLLTFLNNNFHQFYECNYLKYKKNTNSLIFIQRLPKLSGHYYNSKLKTSHHNNSKIMSSGQTIMTHISHILTSQVSYYDIPLENILTLDTRWIYKILLYINDCSHRIILKKFA